MAYLDARPAPPDSSLTKFLAILKIVHLANAVSVFVSTLARFLAILMMVHLATAVYLFVCTPFPAPTSDLSSVNPIEFNFTAPFNQLMTRFVGRRSKVFATLALAWPSPGRAQC